MRKQKGKEKPKQSASATTSTSPCHWPGSPVASISRLACGRAWVDINKANEYRTVPLAPSCTPAPPLGSPLLCNTNENRVCAGCKVACVVVQLGKGKGSRGRVNGNGNIFAVAACDLQQNKYVGRSNTATAATAAAAAAHPHLSSAPLPALLPAPPPAPCRRSPADGTWRALTDLQGCKLRLDGAV